MNIKKQLTAKYTFSEDEVLLKYKINTLLIGILLTVTTAAVMGVIRYMQSNYTQAIANIIFTIIVIICYIGLRRAKKNYQLVSRIILISSMAVVLFVMHSASESEARILWISIIVIMSFFLRDKNEGVLLSGVFMMTIIAIQAINPDIFHLSSVDFFILIVNIILISSAMLWYEKIKSSIEFNLTKSKNILEDQVKIRTIELEMSKDAAEASSRAKSDFLANMSHELRTPMNSIIGLSYISLQDGLDPKNQKNIQKVYDSAISLLDIINDVLDFSKIESDELDVNKFPFNLDHIIDSLSKTTKEKANKKGIELVVDIDSKTPKALLGDSERLEQVLFNLLDNAVKFSDKSGKIIFGIDVERDDKESVTLHFYVKDDGIGMNEDEQRTLFKPFNQADMSSTRKYGGIGLGLAVSKRIVELMNGKIWLESKSGIGSTFHISIDFEKQAKEIIKVKSDNKIVKEVKSIKKIDAEEFASLSSKLKGYLEDSDTNSINIYTSLKSLPGIAKYSDELDKIEIALNNYDFDEAIEYLDILIATVEKGNLDG